MYDITSYFSILLCGMMLILCTVVNFVLAIKFTWMFQQLKNQLINCTLCTSQLSDYGLYQTSILPPIRILWLYTDWWSGEGTSSCRDVKYSITGCLCPPIETAFCIGTLWDLVKKVCSSGFWCQGNDSQGNICEPNKDKCIMCPAYYCNCSVVAMSLCSDVLYGSKTNYSGCIRVLVIRSGVLWWIVCPTTSVAVVTSQVQSACIAKLQRSLLQSWMPFTTLLQQ